MTKVQKEHDKLKAKMEAQAKEGDAALRKMEIMGRRRRS